MNSPFSVMAQIPSCLSRSLTEDWWQQSLCLQSPIGEVWRIALIFFIVHTSGQKLICDITSLAAFIQETMFPLQLLSLCVMDVGQTSCMAVGTTDRRLKANTPQRCDSTSHFECLWRLKQPDFFFFWLVISSFRSWVSPWCKYLCLIFKDLTVWGSGWSSWGTSYSTQIKSFIPNQQKKALKPGADGTGLRLSLQMTSQTSSLIFPWTNCQRTESSESKILSDGQQAKYFYTSYIVRYIITDESLKYK